MKDASEPEVQKSFHYIIGVFPYIPLKVIKIIKKPKSNLNFDQR